MLLNALGTCLNIVLDSGPMGLLTTPTMSSETVACEEWLAKMISARHRIVLPEIIVYELRRELLRMNKRKSLERLDNFKRSVSFHPLETLAMDKAAEFWAESRKRGKPTASEKALDVDVILAAQAWQLTLDGSPVIIATTNRKHLAQYVPAEHWKAIHS